MGKETVSYKLVKKFIRKRPMTNNLLKKFQENGLEKQLEMVYKRSIELFEENKDANQALMGHLEQILPCIAFYEQLIVVKGTSDNALKLYEKWSLCGMDKYARTIQNILKFPGIYRLIPNFFDKMIDKLFGTNAGFESKKVDNAEGFARDMLVCPYDSICNKYGYPELTQFFCKSDDICYGNMHPKLVWERTKTLGRGDDCCDFRLYINCDK
jgi:hypothetical protein